MDMDGRQYRASPKIISKTLIVAYDGERSLGVVARNARGQLLMVSV